MQNNKLKVKNFNLKDSISKKEYNEKLFDIVAPRYDFVTRVLSFGRDIAWKKLLIKELPASGVETCLDLACGTGDITYMLYNNYNNANITGFDLNDEMLKISLKRYKVFSGNMFFEKGDMCNTKKPDDSYDIVTGSYALRNAPNIPNVIKEIYRVTKQGGKCAFLDFSKSKVRLIQKMQLFFLRFWGSLWGVILHGNSEIYAYIADSLQLYPEREELKKIIEGTGFKNLKSKILFFGFIEIITFEKL
ncbi:MAG: hypothetical protein A2015_09705 [Spirochaetes bacterium GWF1_31_7]|nr:MAG: hypothetical protein A2Y30_04470 [Spirochaetes bacterium GWE1_32_154]OHD47561.1 MAG: hypothetical protein A2015_09705 [Spirochaetes bacterium GWF1_31_7]OHD52051.1 MAG: hypothetical protein A2Y29_17465 [Spirochaetes bacterium GWE2_31_10]